jgi:branched-chain amino acid aminotransferase
MIVWWNGELMEASAVRISPMDHGLLVGDGVFETLVAKGGRAYAMLRHWLRMRASCKIMGLKSPTEAEFRDAVQSVLRASGLEEARVRVTLTSGAGPAGSERGGGDRSFWATATELKPWGEMERVAMSRWPRLSCGALAGVKSTSYGENVVALAYAKSKGCGECLFLNEEAEVCEGTGSNIFFVSEGGLWTPPLSSGCLAGVTRGLVLELATVLGLEVSEEPIPLGKLYSGLVDEVFLTSSTRDVQGVCELGDLTFAGVGRVTALLREEFLKWQSHDVDPRPIGG